MLEIFSAGNSFQICTVSRLILANLGCFRKKCPQETFSSIATWLLLSRSKTDISPKVKDKRSISGEELSHTKSIVCPLLSAKCKGQTIDIRRRTFVHVLQKLNEIFQVDRSITNHLYVKLKFQWGGFLRFVLVHSMLVKFFVIRVVSVWSVFLYREKWLCVVFEIVLQVIMDEMKRYFLTSYFFFSSCSQVPTLSEWSFSVTMDLRYSFWFWNFKFTRYHRFGFLSAYLEVKTNKC